MRPRTLLLLALLASAGRAAVPQEEEERLPGWRGEVSRGSGSVGLLRGAAKATRAAARAAAGRPAVVRLPEDGIPAKGTVHPDVRPPLRSA